MEESSKMSLKKAGDLFKAQSALISFLILFIFASLKYEEFLTVLNISNLLRQVSMLGLISIGMTFVILTGGIDLSVGSIFAISGIIAAELTGTNAFLMVVVPVIVCGLMGFFNGFIIGKLKIAPFIVTLATMMGYRGIAYIVSDRGFSKPIENEAFIYIGRGYVLGVPIPALILILGVVIAVFVCEYTRFGRHVYAVGGNEEAAKMMGLRHSEIKIAVYTLSGLLSGIAGVILAARLGAGQPTAGIGYELDAVASVVIGGTLLTGGVGKVSGTFIGALILAMIGNIINMQGNINTCWQNVLTGALLLIVVVVQSQIRKSKQL